MKVAVSVPDPVFRAAEGLARKLKKSRSRLYSEAIAEYVEARGAYGISEKLDAVYAVESSKLNVALEHAQLKSVKDETW